jgi:hypothetical protein
MCASCTAAALLLVHSTSLVGQMYMYSLLCWCLALQYNVLQGLILKAWHTLKLTRHDPQTSSIVQHRCCILPLAALYHIACQPPKRGDRRPCLPSFTPKHCCLMQLGCYPASWSSKTHSPARCCSCRRPIEPCLKPFCFHQVQTATVYTDHGHACITLAGLLGHGRLQT